MWKFKIILPLIVLFSFGQILYAEIDQQIIEPVKSKWEFGLGLNMVVTSDRGFVINVNPSAQYFVFDNFSVGGFVQFYSDELLRHLSFGPSATLFIMRTEMYSLVLNQLIRFRQYIKPDDIDAAGTVSLTTLAVDYSVGNNLALRLGVGYKRSFDGERLNLDNDKEEEWIFPTFGFAYYL